MQKRSNHIMKTLDTRSDVHSEEAGFSILETTVALLLMAIVGLGAGSLFYFAVKNTESAGDRELAMSVGQQKMEQLRNVDFRSADLTATTGTSETITRAGRSYTLLTVISDSNVVSGQATAKTLTVRVTPNSDSSAWAGNITSIFGSVTLVTQRTALTVGPNRTL